MTKTNGDFSPTGTTTSGGVGCHSADQTLDAPSGMNETTVPSKSSKNPSVTVLTAVPDSGMAADKAAILARALAYEPDLEKRKLSKSQWDKYGPRLRARAVAAADNVGQVRALLGNALSLLSWGMSKKLPLGDDLERLWLNSTRGRFLNDLEKDGTSTSSIATVRMHLRRMAEADPTSIDATVSGTPAEELPEPGFTVLDSRKEAAEVGDFGLVDEGTYWDLLDLIGAQVRSSLPTAYQPRSQTPGRDTVVPYGMVEVTRMMRAVLGLRDRNTRRALRAFFALGLGAGLEGMSLALAKPEDVHKGGLAVDVRASNDTVTRTVPVLAPFSAVLTSVAMEAGEARMLGGNNATGTARQNRPSTLASRLRDIDPLAVRLDSTRLRATWIVVHLACRNPLSELMLAAGVTSLDAFDNLMPYVPTLPGDLTVPWTGLTIPKRST